jgi:hypothetical protein
MYNYHTPFKYKNNNFCFDGDTEIILKDGTIKKISEISLNDILIDNGVVTSFFILSSSTINMYNFDNIIVSGCHRILFNNEWIPIIELEESEEIDDYRKEEIYCLSTTTKHININNYTFLDWDELDEISMITFKCNARQFINKETEYENIHTFFNGGLIYNTILELEDGTIKNIEDIQINDILRHGGRVFGKVFITTNNLDRIKKFTIRGKEIIGGPNLYISDDDLGNFSTLDMVGDNINNPTILYHLITEEKFIIINNIRLFDYDSCIDTILGNEYLLE